MSVRTLMLLFDYKYIGEPMISPLAVCYTPHVRNLSHNAHEYFARAFEDYMTQYHLLTSEKDLMS